MLTSMNFENIEISRMLEGLGGGDDLEVRTLRGGGLSDYTYLLLHTYNILRNSNLLFFSQVHNIDDLHKYHVNYLNRIIFRFTLYFFTFQIFLVCYFVLLFMCFPIHIATESGHTP